MTTAPDYFRPWAKVQAEESLPATPPAAPLDVPGRYIPSTYTIVHASPCGRAVVYCSNADAGGRPCALAYVLKRKNHEWHHSFKTVEARSAYVEKWLAEVARNIQAHEERKASRRAEKSTYQHPLKVGDILHYSWGYEQTNAEFYQVIEAKGKSVVIREIASEMTNEGTGNSMAGKCRPCPGKFLSPRYEGDDQGKPLRKLVQKGYQGGPILSMDFGVATLCNPTESKYVSWYA